MAVGDYWDVAADPADPPNATIEDVPPAAAPTGGKVRLALAKVLPADAKHRGARRRGSGDKHAAITLDELDDVDEAMRRRNEILVAAIKRTQDLYIVTDQRQVFRLAATDLFVEKAQLMLAQRARMMWRAGIVSTVAAGALMIGLSAFVVWRAQAFASPSLVGNMLALALVEMGAAAVVVFLTVRYLIKLSRSFFHENVATVAKQHGLGFGRLYVYTNPDAVRLKDLQDAFGLDLESTPIFLDIKAKETADTIYSKVTQDLNLSPGR
jgi:hypothetical protein